MGDCRDEIHEKETDKLGRRFRKSNILVEWNVKVM